ncbi:hypothetical protein KZ843_12405 [Pseudomonas aeruginosa]|nr:hypothetical protein [Pseudomonas aeruginosa]MBW6123679.1 hypothetical protein [Pseudomonas aeruginosa]
MDTNQGISEQARIEQAIRKAQKTDVALALICLAPLVSLLWKVVQDERFTIPTLVPMALMYCWAIGMCYLLLIRKIHDKGLRRSILLFSSGAFASCFVLSFVVLPAMLAVGAAPIGTYLMTKLRARYYFELDLRKELAGKTSGHGLLEV